MEKFKDISVSIKQHLAYVEINRPPNNFFDANLIQQIADAYESLDEEDERACCALIAASSSKASLSAFSDGLLSLTNIHPHIYETFVIFEYAG